MSHILLLIPTESGGPGPKQGINDTIEVEYPTSFGTGDFLLRCPVALDGTVSELPDLYVDEVRAEVRAMPRTPTGGRDLVEVIAKVPHKQPDANGMVQYSLGEEGSDFTAAVFQDQFPDLAFVMHATNGAGPLLSMRARLLNDGGTPRALHDGFYMKEHEYWSRFRQDGGSRVGFGVHTFFTRRSDVPVYVFDTIQDFGIFDREANPFNVQANTDGPPYWTKTEIQGIPPGWNIVSAVPRLAENFTSSPPQLIKETFNTLQWCFPGTLIRRIFALYPPGMLAQARQILDMYGLGRTLGDNSFYAQRSALPGGIRMARLTSAYQYGGSNSLNAARAEFRDRNAALLQLYASGNGGGQGAQLQHPAAGWQHTSWRFDGGDAGTSGIDQTVGWTNTREEALYRRNLSMAGTDRCRAGFTHHADGRLVTSHQLAANNASTWNDRNGNPAGGAQGFQPWDVFLEGAPDLMVPQLCFNGDPVRKALAPTNRPWNTPTPGFNTFRPQIEEFEYVRNSHLMRSGFNELRAPAWLANDQASIWMIQALNGFYNLAMNHHGLAGFIRNSGQRHWAMVDLPFAITWMLADPGRQNEGELRYQRGHGWQCELFAAAYAFGNDQFRLQNLERAQTLGAVLALNATALGFQESLPPQGIAGVHPYSEVSHGCTDLGAQRGAFPDRGTAPGGTQAGCTTDPTEPIHEFVQNHEHGYVAQGHFSIIRRVLDGVDASAKAQFLISAQTMIESIYSIHNPPATANANPRFFHVTLIQGDPPLAAYKDWRPAVGAPHDTNDTDRGAFMCTQLYILTGDIRWLDHAMQWRGIFDTGLGPGLQNYDLLIANMFSDSSHRPLTLGMGLGGEIENLP